MGICACRGISDEALELSDFHCSIPMKGMVDSFNVSVAAGILMHHAVCDRTSRLVMLVALYSSPFGSIIIILKKRKEKELQ